MISYSSLYVGSSPEPERVFNQNNKLTNMAEFQTRDNLPVKDKVELERIMGITSAMRSTVEAAFYAALLPYVTNEIISRDDDDLIVLAAGNTLPTGYEGFKHGSTFIKLDSADKALYENTGTSTSAAWNLIGSIAPAEIGLAAGKILTGGATGVAAETTFPTNHIVYVDGARTDTYTEDGSFLWPYKKISTAQVAINAVCAANWDTQAHFDTLKFVLKIAPGEYSDNVSITTPKYLRWEMDGVIVSGDITCTQEQLGISSYYGKVEFVGGSANRTEKGEAAKITGDIIFAKTAYDSLAYDAFIGVEIYGDILYGAAAGEGHGTWVLYLEKSVLYNSAKSITTNFAAGAHCVLLETFGYNDIRATLTGVIDLYDCNNTVFKNINITPYNGCKVRSSKFTGTVSIVASKNLEMDLESMISMYGRTPTLTGMSLLPLQGSAEVWVPISAAQIIGMKDAPVTLVPAVTGKTIVIDDIVLKMVTTATQFANGTAVEFRYTDAAGAKVTADIAASVIQAGAGTSYTINKSIITSLVGVISSPIIMTNATTAFDTGTGTAVVYVRYHLI